jgi:hypothetical protein
MIPAPLVRDVKGIVDAVGARQQRPGSIEPPQNPVLLEPADMPYLPDRRLDEVPARSEQLGVGESVQQLELDRPRVEERLDQTTSRRPNYSFQSAIYPMTSELSNSARGTRGTESPHDIDFLKKNVTQRHPF